MQRITIATSLIISLSLLTVDAFEDETSNTTLVGFSGSGTPNVSLLNDDQLHPLSNLSVYISYNGNNTLGCIHGGAVSPCLTIQHAYHQTVTQIANVTQFISFIFMDEIYNMTEMLVLNRQASMLKHIKFTSTLRTNITAMSEEAVFWIGCNSSYEAPCISYAIELNNLNFNGFGSNFPAVLVVFNIRFLSLHECIFSFNNRSAINSLDTSIELVNVSFSGNRGSSQFKRPEANLTSFFPMSNISNGGAVAIFFRDGHNKFVNVSHCKFSKNKALVSLVCPFINHTFSVLKSPCAGGGVLIHFMRNCSDVRVKFVDSHFLRNTAFYGGAVTIVSSEISMRNKVTFIGCKLMHNVGTYTGGAILFASMDYAEKNRVTVVDCELCHNRARYGGALKFVINTLKLLGVLHSAVPSLKIIHSKISRNTAQIGSAIFMLTDAYVLKQQLVPVYIIGSRISNNYVPGDEINDPQSILLYHATIVTYKIDIRFIGNSSIERNQFGCGLYAANSNIHINGSLNVSQNIGRNNGGGMTLTDSSYLILHPGSHLIFEENEAGTIGGALAVYRNKAFEVRSAYNRYCFLQYVTPNLPYSKWNTKVEFIRNRAHLKGGAIYISTLTSCTWIEQYPHYSFAKALRWNENFIYEGNHIIDSHNNVVQDDIATDTANLVLQYPHKKIILTPGESTPFNLSAFDELENIHNSVAYGRLNAKQINGTRLRSHLKLSNKYFDLDPYDKKLPQLVYKVDRDHYKDVVNESVQHQIIFSVPKSIPTAQVSVNMIPADCRPGYAYNGIDSCHCDFRVTYIISCDGTKVTLTTGLWGISISGKLVTYQCPQKYCKCTLSTKPVECIYDSSDENSQCSENRHGVLCGSCKGPNDNVEYGISLYTRLCVECDPDNMMTAMSMLAFLTAGVFIAAALIVYFDPSFSTKMRGPAFYMQVLPYSYVGRSFMVRISSYIAAFLTLGSSSNLPVPGCLGHDWSMLDIMALQYIFAAAILLALIVICVVNRYSLLHFEDEPSFESMWILVIVAYFILSETSLSFFYCLDINGKSVFFYDGTVECFNRKHLLMVIISSIIFVMLVLLPPITIVAISTGRVSAPMHVVDALTNGLRSQFHWWWALDLIRRLAYVSISVFIGQDVTKKVLFVVLSNFFATVHASFKPYKDTFSNVSETLLLLSMATTASIQLFSTEGPAEDIATTIVTISYIYICILFLYLLVRFIARKYIPKLDSIFRRFENYPNPRPKIPIPNRVEQSYTDSYSD